jgi:imidazolonepropionase-like amidohydrolase
LALQWWFCGALSADDDNGRKGKELVSAILYENVRVFDGFSEQLAEGQRVLVTENRIQEISGKAIKPPKDAVRLDGKGRVLMPGLIDCHYHAILSTPIPKIFSTNQTYVGVAAKIALEATLRRGFTTVRDAGGADFGLMMALEEGLIDGPRVFPSGRPITQTAGHADFRPINAEHPGPGHDILPSLNSAAALADGVGEVLRAVREELRQGAKQIKIMAGGGVVSPADPIHTVQYTPEETRAAVQAAANWGTYVLAHAYTPQAIRQCLENGVQSIEHGNLIDEDCARLAAEKNAFVVPNLVAYWAFLQQDNIPSLFRAKGEEVWAHAQHALELLRRAGVKVGYGSDLVGDIHRFQSREFGLRREVFSPLEILRQATSLGAELVERCGMLNPHGKLGVIQTDAMADLLVVDGNPLEDVTVLEEPEKNIPVIVKDGRFVKNELS